MQWLMELYGVMQMQSDAVSTILFHEIQELFGYVFVGAIQSTCVPHSDLLQMLFALLS